MSKTKAIVAVMAIVLVVVIYLFLNKIDEILSGFGVI